MTKTMDMQKMHANRLAAEIDRLTLAISNAKGDQKMLDDLSCELGDLIAQNFPAITSALRFYARGGKRFPSM